MNTELIQLQPNLLVVKNVLSQDYLVKLHNAVRVGLEDEEWVRTNTDNDSKDIPVGEYIVKEYHIKDFGNAYKYEDKVVLMFSDAILYSPSHKRVKYFTKKMIYKKWDNMFNRCERSHSKNHEQNYQDRGIEVCDEWQKSSKSFILWSLLFTNYFEDSRIDRINDAKVYSPENVKYSTSKESTINRRNTIYILYSVIILPLADWARKLDVEYGYLYYRYKKYGEEVAKNEIRRLLDLREEQLSNQNKSNAED